MHDLSELDQVVTEISDRKESVAEAEQRRDQIIRDLHAAGTTVAELARRSHLSRQTIYTILKQQQ